MHICVFSDGTQKCPLFHFLKEKQGCIINISSTNGLDTYYEYSLDYDASKAGMISLTHNLALHYAPYIRVNCVAPGWINTEMNKDLDEEYKKVAGLDRK